MFNHKSNHEKETRRAMLGILEDLQEQKLLIEASNQEWIEEFILDDGRIFRSRTYPIVDERGEYRNAQ